MGYNLISRNALAKRKHVEPQLQIYLKSDASFFVKEQQNSHLVSGDL